MSLLLCMSGAAQRPGVRDDCPKEILRIIQSCWAASPGNRPDFDGIVEALSEVESVFCPKV